MAGPSLLQKDILPAPRTATKPMYPPPLYNTCRAAQPCVQCATQLLHLFAPWLAATATYRLTLAALLSHAHRSARCVRAVLRTAAVVICTPIGHGNNVSSHVGCTRITYTQSRRASVWPSVAPRLSTTALAVLILHTCRAARCVRCTAAALTHTQIGCKHIVSCWLYSYCGHVAALRVRALRRTLPLSFTPQLAATA